MRLRGEFVVRQVVDEIVAIPVGSTALEFGGMILLNDVSKTVWDCLQQPTDLAAIVAAVTDRFEVTPQEAENDIVIFLEGLREIGILQE